MEEKILVVDKELFDVLQAIQIMNMNQKKHILAVIMKDGLDKNEKLPIVDN